MVKRRVERFEIDEGTNGTLIYDNYGPDDYYFIEDKKELEQFVKLINKLNDKIINLEKELYALRNDCNSQRTSKNYYKNRCIYLENQINDLKEKLQHHIK